MFVFHQGLSQLKFVPEFLLAFLIQTVALFELFSNSVT